MLSIVFSGGVVYIKRMITLQDAIKFDQLDEFIAQEEARGVKPITKAEFDETASAVIKTPPQSDQTSGSPRRDGLREK